MFGKGVFHQLTIGTATPLETSAKRTDKIKIVDVLVYFMTNVESPLTWHDQVWISIASRSSLGTQWSLQTATFL